MCLCGARTCGGLAAHPGARRRARGCRRVHQM